MLHFDIEVHKGICHHLNPLNIRSLKIYKRLRKIGKTLLLTSKDIKSLRHYFFIWGEDLKEEYFNNPIVGAYLHILPIIKIKKRSTNTYMLSKMPMPIIFGLLLEALMPRYLSTFWINLMRWG